MDIKKNQFCWNVIATFKRLVNTKLQQNKEDVMPVMYFINSNNYNLIPYIIFFLGYQNSKIRHF